MKAMKRLTSVFTALVLVAACVLVTPWVTPASAMPENSEPQVLPNEVEQPEASGPVQNESVAVQPELLLAEDELDTSQDEPSEAEVIFEEDSDFQPRYVYVVQDDPQTEGTVALHSEEATHTCLFVVTSRKTYYTHKWASGKNTCVLVTEEKGHCVVYDGNCPNENREGTTTYDKQVSHVLETKLISSNHTKPD